MHLHGASDSAEDARAYFERVAEPLDGPLVHALGQVAAEAGVWLVPGSIAERGADGRVYNARRGGRAQHRQDHHSRP